MSSVNSYISHVWSVFQSFTRYIEVKIAGGLLVTLYSFFFSVHLWQAMLAVLALVTFDMFTGVAAAKKTGVPIESRNVCKSAFKLGVYGLLVSSGHLTDVALGIPPTWFNLESAMIGFLAATELISILENVGRMGFAVPQRILNQLEDFRKHGPRNEK